MDYKMKRIVLILFCLSLILLLFAGKKTGKSNPKPTSKPLVTFVELGSVSCIPCKMMKPVMEDIEKEYGSKIQVIFYDVKQERQKASDYKIRVIPTQVFLDKKGREFHRHEGFYPKADIMKILDKQMGIKRKLEKTKQ